MINILDLTLEAARETLGCIVLVLLLHELEELLVAKYLIIVLSLLAQFVDLTLE